MTGTEIQKKFNPKITLVGAGQIGGTLAFVTGLKKLSSNIVMLDVMDGVPQGKALDLVHAFTAEDFSCNIVGSTDIRDNSESLINSDVVIVTAGFPRKPGMSREDLLAKNATIIRQVGQAIGKQCPGAFVICVTNPLDVMVLLLQKASGLPPSRVVGMAGILDSLRFRRFLAEALNLSVRDVQTIVLGGHGDDMVPLKKYTSIGGLPLVTFIQMGLITDEQVDNIINRTRHAGGEIVGLLKTGSAFAAPAMATLAMVEAYLRDEKRMLSCCAYLNGEYGKSGIYAGVPVIIGAGGVERIIELPLDNEDREKVQKSLDSVSELRRACMNLGFDV